MRKNLEKSLSTLLQHRERMTQVFRDASGRGVSVKGENNLNYCILLYIADMCIVILAQLRENSTNNEIVIF